MRIHVIITIFLLLLAFLLLMTVTPSLPYHWVGEPELERSQIWRKCCERDDCIVQNVQIFSSMQDEVWTGIDEETVLLHQGKFHPAPTSHTWVCYFYELRVVTPENIRCILLPNNVPLT